MIPYPQTISLPQSTPPAIFPFLTAFSVVILVFVCIVIFSVAASFAIIIIIYIICQCFMGPTTSSLEEHRHDLESGTGDRNTNRRRSILISHRRHHHNRRSGSSSAEENGQSNIWQEVIERTMEAIEESRGFRRQAVEKLMPPAVRYGSSEIVWKCSDCAICLDDFVNGEMCQIFPVCNHIFHFHCIRHWLKKNVTCPICRFSILNDQ